MSIARHDWATINRLLGRQCRNTHTDQGTVLRPNQAALVAFVIFETDVSPPLSYNVRPRAGQENMDGTEWVRGRYRV